MAEPVTSRELLGLFKKSPARIVSFFRAKGYEISWDWRDVWQGEHARAFTVAKAVNQDILETLRGGVDSMVVNGWSERRFINEMTPELKARGWWGKEILRNPKTGELQEVQLGSAWRLKTIYRTNTSTAFARGRYATQIASVSRRPWWQYDALNDSLTRPTHRDLDERVFRHDDPIWNSIYPPNGFNCRCLVRALTDDQVRDKDLEISEGRNLPPTSEFPDEGWNYNPGNETVEAMARRIQAPRVPRIPSSPAATQAPARAPKIRAPESLHEKGRAAVAQAWVRPWMDPKKHIELAQGRGGDFQKLTEIFDQPLKSKSRAKGAAYYDGDINGPGSIRMTGIVRGYGDQSARGTYRHEYGHHLDHEIGKYLQRSKGKDLIEDAASNYAVKAWEADTRLLDNMGLDTYKLSRKKYLAQFGKAAERLPDRYVIHTTDLSRAWQARLDTIVNRLGLVGSDESTALFEKSARILKKDKGLIARVYREAVKGGYKPSLADEVLLAEAVEGGELSVLLRSKYVLEAAFKSKGWNFGKFSDLIGAVTREQFGGHSWNAGGHGVAYYRKRTIGGVSYGQGHEAFANMTEGLVNRGDKLYEDLLKTFVPNFSSWWDDLIKEVLNDAKSIL